jgi:hypothetical protein
VKTASGESHELFSLVEIDLVAGRSELQGEPGAKASGVLLESRINAAKLRRACGGCLGARRRRRAWKTAISPGEWSNAC